MVQPVMNNPWKSTTGLFQGHERDRELETKGFGRQLFITRNILEISNPNPLLENENNAKLKEQALQ